MDQFEQLAHFLLPHWPALAWMTIAGITGRVMSKSVFTKARAVEKHDKPWKSHFWWWGRQTLALHPVAAGFFLGLFWRNPEGASPAWPTIGASIYFGASGGLSTWAYEVVKGLLKKRGIDIEGGESVVPPEPPAETP